MRAWDKPSARVARYLVPIGYHFHFTPRQIDEFTVSEFDTYAATCDEIAQQNERAQREANSRGRRR